VSEVPTINDVYDTNHHRVNSSSPTMPEEPLRQRAEFTTLATLRTGVNGVPTGVRRGIAVN